jgi:uncharacterized protein (DUF697 family)
MARSETRWLAYGAISAALQRVLPPFVDEPFLRSVRGAMVDRVAKEAGVTLTAEARKLLASLEDPMSSRGRVERGARWLLARVVPGLGVVNSTLHLMSTFTAGALLRRYLARRPKSETGSVIDGFEATRVRRALKVALDFATAEHARGLLSAVGAAAGAAVDGSHPREATGGKARALAERALHAVDAGASAIPVAWIDAVEPIFWREFDR